MAEKFYHPNGLPVYPDAINEDVDFVEAVSEDDKVVELVGCDRIRAGAPGTGEGCSISLVWHRQAEKQMPEGFCALILGLPAALERAVEARQAAGKPYKRWLQNHQYLSYQLMDDEELLAEILEDGIDAWLAQAQC